MSIVDSLPRALAAGATAFLLTVVLDMVLPEPVDAPEFEDELETEPVAALEVPTTDKAETVAE